MKKITFYRVSMRFDDYVKEIFSHLSDWECEFSTQLGQLNHCLILNAEDWGAKSGELNELIAKLPKDALVFYLAPWSANFNLDGVILLDTAQSPEYHLSTMRQTLALFAANTNKEVPDHQIAEGIGYLVSHSLRELQRVKKIHETLVPLRSETVKGLSFSSKFAAGMSSGGEFFDTISGDKELVLVLSHTSSYVLSSFVMTEFDLLRKRRSFDRETLRGFVESLAKSSYDLINVDGHHCSLFIMRIDLKTFDVIGLNMGEAQLLSTSKDQIEANKLRLDPAFIAKAEFAFSLSRGEKYFLMSPGMRRNTDDFVDGTPLANFIVHRLPAGASSVLHEVFFQLKKTSDDTFLKYDATGIFIEVDTHVIHQI